MLIINASLRGGCNPVTHGHFFDNASADPLGKRVYEVDSLGFFVRFSA
jgi:hypothetical protein